MGKDFDPRLLRMPPPGQVVREIPILSDEQKEMQLKGYREELAKVIMFNRVHAMSTVEFIEADEHSPLFASKCFAFATAFLEEALRWSSIPISKSKA